MNEKTHVITMSLARGLRRAQARQARASMENPFWEPPNIQKTKKGLLIAFEETHIETYGEKFVKRISLDKKKGASWLVSCPVVSLGWHDFHKISVGPVNKRMKPRYDYFPVFLTDHCMERLIAKSHALGVRPISQVYELLLILEGDHSTKTLANGDTQVDWTISGNVEVATSNFMFYADFHDEETLLVRTAIDVEGLDSDKIGAWEHLRTLSKPRRADRIIHPG